MKACPFFAARVHCAPCRAGAGSNGFPAECPHADKAPWLDTKPESVERPGTELKRLLEQFGITAGPGCKCLAMARQMDAWGCDESERHLPEIAAVMETEANRRGWMRFLPFKELGAAGLVRLAIHQARQK